MSSALLGVIKNLGAKGVTSDSRKISPGIIFVAHRGVSQDGHDFLKAADSAGAVALVGERAISEKLNAPYFQVPDGREALAELAAHFSGNPSHALLMVGVTGTSGKTTTTYMIEALLMAAGHRVGVIGTVNFRYPGKIIDSSHTTPGSVELQALLAEMKSAGCTAVVMEVSSHALKQKRVEHIAFDAVVFTNLSREHLDFHPDMEDYFAAKGRLFREVLDYSKSVGKKPIAIINGDDEYGQRLAKNLNQNLAPLLYGLDRKNAISGENLKFDLQGIQGLVGKTGLKIEMAGKFNAYNALAALAVAQGLGIDSKKIEAGFSQLIPPPGRLEKVDHPHITVFVDYAHKPDALEKVLKTLREIATRRLLTVFGCGGDRDKTKRAVMGKIAASLSDQVFVTSDNPRTEDPKAIIEEIVMGMQGHENYEVEPDRKAAIGKAIAWAKPKDIVLIAGKGHEDYQILKSPTGGTYKIHFDDREIARDFLAKKSSL